MQIVHIDLNPPQPDRQQLDGMWAEFNGELFPALLQNPFVIPHPHPQASN